MPRLRRGVQEHRARGSERTMRRRDRPFAAACGAGSARAVCGACGAADDPSVLVLASRGVTATGSTATIPGTERGLPPEALASPLIPPPRERAAPANRDRPSASDEGAQDLPSTALCQTGLLSASNW